MDVGGIRFGAEITAAAARHNLDPRLLAAIAAQETGGPGSNSGQNIVGDGGHGRGVFQIDDRSWAFARTPAAMDPAQNAEMAATILHDNLQRYGGNERMAVSAYNSGSPTAAGTLTTWNDGTTLSYADSVFRHYHELGGDPHGQLRADNRDTAGNVNALAALGATQPAAADVSASLAQEIAPFTPSAPPQTATSTATTPSTATTAANDAQAEADQNFAALIDQGDVFDDAGEDAP